MPRTRTIATTTGVGLAGLLGGGLLAATLSATAAEDPASASATAGAYRLPGGHGDLGGRDGRGGPGGAVGPLRTPVSDEVAAAIEQAVLAEYPGATVERSAQEGADGDGEPVYEAHVVQADGAEAHVLLDGSYTVTGEEKRPEGGRDGEGPCRGGPGMPGASSRDAAVAGSVRQAVLAAYPQATVDAIFRDGVDEAGEPAYEAHVSRADGTEVHVLVDSTFAVTGTGTVTEEEAG